MVVSHFSCSECCITTRKGKEKASDWAERNCLLGHGPRTDPAGSFGTAAFQSKKQSICLGNLAPLEMDAVLAAEGRTLCVSTGSRSEVSPAWRVCHLQEADATRGSFIYYGYITSA